MKEMPTMEWNEYKICEDRIVLVNISDSITTKISNLKKK